MEGIDVTTAVLWIYKKHSFPNSLTQTLYISEVEVDNSNNGYLVKERPLGIHTYDVEGKATEWLTDFLYDEIECEFESLFLIDAILLRSSS